jgi:hypothetical protein
MARFMKGTVILFLVAWIATAIEAQGKTPIRFIHVYPKIQYIT